MLSPWSCPSQEKHHPKNINVSQCETLNSVNVYHNVSKAAAVCKMSYHINAPQSTLCLPPSHPTQIPCRVHVLQNKKETFLLNIFNILRKSAKHFYSKLDSVFTHDSGTELQYICEQVVQHCHLVVQLSHFHNDAFQLYPSLF